MSRAPAGMMVGIYALAVGILMFGFWGTLLLTGQVPELQERPRELAFHLTAELGTAFVLLLAGGAVLKGGRWARSLTPLALGMLLYTVVNSAGFYAQQGNLPMVVLFAVLIGLTALSIVSLSRQAKLGRSQLPSVRQSGS